MGRCLARLAEPTRRGKEYGIPDDLMDGLWTPGSLPGSGEMVWDKGITGAIPDAEIIYLSG